MILDVILRRDWSRSVFHFFTYWWVNVSNQSFSNNHWILFLHSTEHNIFEHERSQGQLKFGTSVFHAYVHNWGCQLEYNPRLNLGWGMSDGEGSERLWFKLSKLVAALRYVTKQHWLNSLALKAEHEKWVERSKAGVRKNLMMLKDNQLIQFVSSWITGK